jgi:hypothetical protein
MMMKKGPANLAKHQLDPVGGKKSCNTKCRNIVNTE